MSQATTGIREAAAGSSALLQRVARRLTITIARRIRVGRLTIVLPDGSRHTVGRPGSQPTGEMHIHDTAALVRMLLGGETGAGEAYMDGHWSSPDLPGLLRLAALNREALALPPGGGAPRSRFRARSLTGCAGTRWTRHGAISRPTTTWATTSTACSSTRR